MDIGEVSNSIWLTYESSKLFHVIMKLLLLKMICWPAVTTKMKSDEAGLHKLGLECG